MEIERDLLELYKDPDPGHEAGAAGAPRRRVLQRGGGAADRVAARRPRRHPGRRHVQPRAHCPDLPDDVVVEVPARITRDGAEPLKLAPLAPDMHGLVEAVRGYEELTIEAAKSGDRRVALRALAANPLVPGLGNGRDAARRAAARTRRTCRASSLRVVPRAGRCR